MGDFLLLMGVVDDTAFMAFMAFIDVTLPLADFAMADKWEAKVQTPKLKSRLNTEVVQTQIPPEMTDT